MAEEDELDFTQLSDDELRRLIRKRLSYKWQCWALLVKNATAQKRAYRTNVCQCITPILLVLHQRTWPSEPFPLPLRPAASQVIILFILQVWIDSLVNSNTSAYPNPVTQSPFFM